MATSGPQPPAALAAQLQEGIAFHQRGQLAEAEQAYVAILNQQPLNFDALQLLGLIASQCGYYEDAVRLIGQALAIKSDHAPAQYNIGMALLALRRSEEALTHFDKALAMRPRYVEAQLCRGNALFDLKRREEAVVAYDRAIALRSDYSEAYSNRAIVLLELNRIDEALVSIDRAMVLDGNNPAVLTNRGLVLVQLRRLPEAIENYDRALAINPAFVNAHLSAGLARLLVGDFARGWEEFEWRWQAEPMVSLPRKVTGPQWTGEDIAGKTIFIHAEQGLGDTLQFCRYAPMVAARGARVILEVQEPLKPLLEGLDGVAQLIVRGDALPAFDVQCPLMSLPRAFATTAATIPGKVPYLHPDPARVAEWRAKLGETSALRVGIAWSGSAQIKNDQNRSIGIAKFATFLGPNVEVFSLQKEVRPDDAAWLAAHPEVRHFGDGLRDFADTAAVVSLLDLVISVDTSVAHLAGALGKDVWILIPYLGVDWRWLLDRDDNAWYPSARLFRQPAQGDWDSVIARVAAELAQRRR